MRHGSGGSTGVAGLVGRACVALGAAGAAATVAALPAMATTGTWSQSLAVTIAPGTTLRAGYDVSMPGGHPAATLTVAGGSVTVKAKCPDGTQTHLAVSLPQQSYGIPAGSNVWFPSGDSSSAATYQGSVAVPWQFCGGRSGSSSAVVFSADFTSTDGQDKVSVRFHVADGSSGGGWSGTDSVVPSVVAASTQAPSAPTAPAPAPAPTRSTPAPLAPRTTPRATASSAIAPTPAATAAPVATPAAPTAAATATATPGGVTWLLTPAGGHPVAALRDAADATPSTLLAAMVAALVGGASWVGRRRVAAVASRRRRGRA